jgi:hypothetical protein
MRRLYNGAGEKGNELSLTDLGMETKSLLPCEECNAMDLCFLEGGVVITDIHYIIHQAAIMKCSYRLRESFAPPKKKKKKKKL